MGVIIEGEIGETELDRLIAAKVAEEMQAAALKQASALPTPFGAWPGAVAELQEEARVARFEAAQEAAAAKAVEEERLAPARARRAREVAAVEKQIREEEIRHEQAMSALGVEFRELNARPLVVSE